MVICNNKHKLFNAMAKSSVFKPLQCLEPCSWKFGVSNPLGFTFGKKKILGKISPFFEKKLGDNFSFLVFLVPI
jgi:hypothetical protein